MKTPYQRGRNLEYRVAAQLVRLGAVAQRSAQSRSAVDLWVLKDGWVVMVQCKILRSLREAYRTWEKEVHGDDTSHVRRALMANPKCDYWVVAYVPSLRRHAFVCRHVVEGAYGPGQVLDFGSLSTCIANVGMLHFGA